MRGPRPAPRSGLGARPPPRRRRRVRRPKAVESRDISDLSSQTRIVEELRLKFCNSVKSSGRFDRGGPIFQGGLV